LLRSNQTLFNQLTYRDFGLSFRFRAPLHEVKYTFGKS